MKNNSAILKALILFVFVALILTPGFYRNQWKMAGKKWFYDWRKQSDYMVVGRLAHSRETGFFSESGLLGTVDGAWPQPPGIVEHQYEVYLGQLSHQSYWAYKSSIGFHGVLFSVFDRYTGYPENFNLKVFSGIASLMSALSLALLVAWLFLEVGLLPALLAFAFMVLSEWLTLFGGDMYWQLWAFYLPALLVFYFFWFQNNTKTDFKPVQLLWLVYFSVLLKVIFTGFEFITVALAMLYPPVVYYAILQSWALKDFISLSVRIGIGAFLGVLTGLGILVIQVAGVLKGFQPAIAFIFSSFSRRTYGDANLFSVEAESLKASTLSVIWKYMTGRAVNLGGWIQDDPRFVAVQDITYLPIFILFALVSFLFLALYFSDRPLVKKSSLALFGAMWFSLLSPLSWLIIFKAHAYIHGNLDYIIWQMPFTLFGFAVCGDVVRMIFFRLFKRPSLVTPNG